MANLNRPSRESELVPSNHPNANINGLTASERVETAETVSVNPAAPSPVPAVDVAALIAQVLMNPDALAAVKAILTPVAATSAAIIASPVLARQTNFDPSAKVADSKLSRAVWYAILLGSGFGRAQGVYVCADKTAAYFAALRPVETMQGKYSRKFVGNGTVRVWRGLDMPQFPDNATLFAAYMTAAEFESWKAAFPESFALIADAPHEGVDGCGVPFAPITETVKEESNVSA